MLELLMSFDYGTVPAWFGGISFVLAFWIFLKDRRARERDQVESVGVWYDNNQKSMDGETGRFILHFNNPSKLPVHVVYTTYWARSQWSRPDNASKVEPPGVAQVEVVEPGQQRVKMTLSRRTLAPEEHYESEQLVNFRDLGPPGNEWTIRDQKAVEVDIVQMLIRDNANRRWVVRPNSSRAARRLRWYSLLGERLTNPFHPWSRPIDHFISFWRVAGWRNLRLATIRERRWQMREDMRPPG